MMPNVLKIVDFVSSVLNSCLDTGTIDSAVDNGDGTWTCTTSTLRLNDYYTVDISGVNYLVTNVTGASFDISISTDPTGETWETVINYVYGDPRNVLTDLQSRTHEQKDPIVCLFQPFEEDLNLDEDVPLYINTSLWMAFMRPFADQWTTSEHYIKAIDPMNALVWDFLTELKKLEGNTIVRMDSLKKVDHHQYGLWNRTKGHETQILEKVSGVELLSLNLQLSKQYSCNT